MFRAVKRNGLMLQAVPEKLRTKKMCEAAVLSNFEALKFVPKELKTKVITEDIALEAMQINGDNLHLIPQQIITSKIAEAAVYNCPHSLRWIPNELRTPEMYLYTTKNFKASGITIQPKLLYGNNIFVFAQKVEKTINQQLLYEELKRLYSGEAIKVKNVQTKNKKIATCEIRYNREKNKLNLREVARIDIPQNLINRPVIKPGKLTKGLKL